MIKRLSFLHSHTSLFHFYTHSSVTLSLLHPRTMHRPAIPNHPRNRTPRIPNVCSPISYDTPLLPDNRGPESLDDTPLLPHGQRPIPFDNRSLIPISCGEPIPPNDRTDPRRRLPLECILNIIRFLAEVYDTDTMFRLLCVDKLTCAATLPFLYGDFFNINMHTHRPRSNKSASRTMSQLIRTLLWQIRPRDQVPGLL